MKNKKKHFITAILATLFLILVLYLIFHDSLGEIKTQLFQADKKALLILVIFGNLYILLDGWVLHYMIVKNREKCTLWQAIRLAYMVVFFNVTTFAAGTKPAQIYDLYQESQIKPGKSFGILTMEYVSHKLTIVLYAAVMLCFFHTVLFQVSGLEKNYLLTGFWVSFAILLFLTMFCINQKFAPWLLRCSDHIKKEKIKEKAKAGIAQMEDFSRVGSVVIKDKQQWIGLIFRNAVKMTCLYALPAVAIFAVTGERLPLSVLECLAFSSVMQAADRSDPKFRRHRFDGTGLSDAVWLYDRKVCLRCSNDPVSHGNVLSAVSDQYSVTVFWKKKHRGIVAMQQCFFFCVIFLLPVGYR